MAILVQPFIDEHMKNVKVYYNGVCITHDIARHAVKHGFTVSWYDIAKRGNVCSLLMLSLQFPWHQVTSHKLLQRPIPRADNTSFGPSSKLH